MILSTASRAAKWDAICASVHVASNNATRSPELTTFLPSPRISSRVPPSTNEITNTRLLGEYCIAMSRQLASIALRSVEKLLPACVLTLRARQRVEMSGFNFVDQLLRFPFGGNQVEPAPRDHQVWRQSENPVGDGIAMVMIVKQPCINVALAERRLYGGKIHWQGFILNYGIGFARICAEGAHQGVFAKIRFRTLGGNVSHAVRSTNLGACSRMLIR